MWLEFCLAGALYVCLCWRVFEKWYTGEIDCAIELGNGVLDAFAEID